MKKFLTLTLVLFLSLFIVGESRGEVRESALHCKNEYGDFRADRAESYPPEGMSDVIYHIIPNYKLWLGNAIPYISPGWPEDVLDLYQGLGWGALREISFSNPSRWSHDGDDDIRFYNTIYDIKESHDKRFYVSKTEYKEEYQHIIDQVRGTTSINVRRNWIEIDRETLNVYRKNWETGEIHEKWVCSIVPLDQLGSHFDKHLNKLQSFITKKYEIEDQKRQEQLRKNKI